MVLYQADVLDWSETMTGDVKAKIHNGLDAGSSYEDIEKSLKQHTMDAIKMSCYIMSNRASISDVALPFVLGMDNESLVDVYEEAMKVAKNLKMSGQKQKFYIDTRLDASVIYKTYMADKCDCMFFECAPHIMSGLASDINTLVSKYDVDVNEERVIDIVSKFTDNASLRDSFCDNLKIHSFVLPKRKNLNALLAVQSDKSLENDDTDNFEC